MVGKAKTTPIKKKIGLPDGIPIIDNTTPVIHSSMANQTKLRLKKSPIIFPQNIM